MGIPALVLALILPLIMFFSATLVIRAGIQMDSVDDLKTKDYFQTSAFADNFYSKASAILTGISAREILDKTAESAYIDLGELYNGDPLKTLPDLPTPSTILRNGARRVPLPMMTGSSWGSPPRKAKQNICTILISKKLWKMEPCS